MDLLPGAAEDDAVMVKLAREIAMDLLPLEDVLAICGVSPEDFEVMRRLPRFAALLDAHVVEWSKAGNTHERTKLKSAILIEDWLPEAHALMHSKTETLNSKTELAKLVAKLAGMGERELGPGDTSGKISITINLGSDHQLKFEKQLVPRVIDADPA